MPIPFDIYDWYLFNDLQRCPYRWGTWECREWNKVEDRRILLVMLDRYADYLQGKRDAPNRTPKIPGDTI